MMQRERRTSVVTSERRSMVKNSLWAAAQKLYVLLIQEPDLLRGFEEDATSIHRELLECFRLFRNFAGDVTEPLRDIAYDVEDFIDYLTLESARGRSRGVVRKKLKKIKDKIRDFYRGLFVLESAIVTEIVEDQKIAQTMVSPVLEKLVLLLAHQATSLLPQVKKKARRMKDEFALINGFLENLESVEWDIGLLEWLEELCDFSCEAMCVINLFVNRKIRLTAGKKKGIPIRSVITALPKMRYELLLGNAMDGINLRLQDLSERTPPQVLDRLQPDHRRRHQDRSSAMFSNYLERPSGDGNADDDEEERADVSSFRGDIQEITARLLADDEISSVVSIVGVRGVGKTTLAKLVYETEVVADHFPYRAWASSSWTVLYLLKDVLKQMDPNRSIPAVWNEEDNNNNNFNSSSSSSSSDEEEEEEGGEGTSLEDFWAKKIREREEKEAELLCLFDAFVKDNKCLIVVDDIKSREIINKLVTRFPDKSWSRMILIARDQSLMSDLPKKNPSFLHLTLQLRDDDESWALFTHVLKVTIPQELLTLKGDILKTCCGLPLIIKELADALSRETTTIDRWSSVLQRQFNGDHHREFPSQFLLEDIDNSLPLHMKRCLFYFGLFPPNFEIPARRLIALWITEGLIHPMHDQIQDQTTETPEDVAKKYLVKLIGQSLVQVIKKKLNGEVQACRLPDPIRKRWFLKAREARFLQRPPMSATSSDVSLGTGAVRRLVDHLDKTDASFSHIHGGDHHHTTLKAHYKDTTSFISFDTRQLENTSNFLRRCVSSGCFLSLQILDLERVYKPNLPVEVGKLTLLKYLGLRWTSLEILPSSVANLLNLHTLDLKHTHVTNLPGEIWKLQQLRHLYLSERYWSKLTHQQPSSGSLTALQTLWGLFIDEKTPVRGGLDGLLNLRKLALKFRVIPSQEEAMQSQLQAVADWVSKLSHLQSLRLTSSDEEDQPWELELKPLSNHEKLSTVYLLGRLRDPLVVSEFPDSLTVLTLSWSGLGEDPMRMLGKLSNLRVLQLLRRSYVGKDMVCSSGGGFRQLRVLRLWWLEQLEEWNVEEGALGALRELEIRSCLSLRKFPEGLKQRAFLEVKLTAMPAQFTA